MPRILLADDHRLMLEGLQRLLAGSVEVVGTVEDGNAAVEAAQALKPDIALFDISMPVLNGLEAARRLRTLVPDLKIIFLTMHTDPMYVIEAFHSGGAGYVLKRSAATELIEAIQIVLEGKPYISPLVIKDMVRVLGKGPGLSSEQQEVLRLMSHGSSATEIAEALNISNKAAVAHISQIIEALDLQKIE